MFPSCSRLLYPHWEESWIRKKKVLIFTAHASIMCLCKSILFKDSSESYRVNAGGKRFRILGPDSVCHTVNLQLKGEFWSNHIPRSKVIKELAELQLSDRRKGHLISEPQFPNLQSWWPVFHVPQRIVGKIKDLAHELGALKMKAPQHRSHF